MLTTLIREYLPYLRQRLTLPRLEHSLGVMRVMRELAEIYQLEPEQAMLAGLLHDIAKDCSHAELLALAEEMDLSFAAPCERHPVYLHATIGAYMTQKTCDIHDATVLRAIATHSYVGPPQHLNSAFAWSLRFADVLAPVREWRGMRKLKRMVYQGKSERAAFLLSGWLLEYFIREQVPIHPQLHTTYAKLASCIPVDETFFDKED